MQHITLFCLAAIAIASFLARSQVAVFPRNTSIEAGSPIQQSPQQPKDQRGVSVQAASPSPTPADPQSVKQQTSPQGKPTGSRPEIVLQAGITSPQMQIGFSPDGRLLASMGIGGNAIKLWEVSSGLLLRQLESSIPSMGSSSMSRPFRFSADGKVLVAFAENRLRRWDVDTGNELPSTTLLTAKDLTNATLSDDGRTLAAISMDRSAIRIWDVVAGRELRVISFRDDEPIAQDAIALSPDGKVLALLIDSVKSSRRGSETKHQLALLDVASGKTVQKFEIRTTSIQFGPGMTVPSAGQVPSIVFTPDGAWVAVRDDELMKIWEVSSGRELKSFRPPSTITSQPDAIFGMFANKFQISNDKRLLSIAGAGGKISLLDAASTNPVHTLSGHHGTVVAISFNVDGKLLATSGTDNQIKLWDVNTGQEVRTLRGAAQPISDIAFSQDGRSLALAGQQGVSFWELTTGAVRRSITLPDEYSGAAQNIILGQANRLSPDGKLLISGSNRQQSAKVWEVATARELPSVALPEGKELGSAAFSADGAALALLETANQKPVAAPSPATGAPSPTGTPPSAMQMPDMTKMMEQIRKDPKKMQEQVQKAQEAMKKGDLNAGFTMMESLGMLPGANKTNPLPNNLRIIEVASGRQLHTVPLSSGFLDRVTSNSMTSSSAVSFSPDGKILASASGFNAPIKLLDLKTGQELRSLTTKLMSVNTIAWSPDSKRVASSHWGLKRNPMDYQSGDSFSFEDFGFSIKIWDAQTGTELKTFSGHNNFVTRLAFSPDGRLLASGSFDSTIKVWDPSSGSELRTLKGHTGSITALGFSPDAKFVISGSDDGSARLWGSETGQLLATLVSLNKGNDWLIVTPDGLFDGSPGGWKQILWRFTPTTFDVSPVEIFFNEYFHPGLLPDILSGKKLAAAVDISQKDRRQPKVSLETADSIAGNISSRTVKLKINVGDAPAGAKDLRLFRNGSLVKVWRGDLLQGKTNAQLETSVKVSAGENQFSAYAFNRDNVKSTDATLSLRGAESLKPAATLHLLAIGVNKYANAGYNLKYAVADGQAFAAEVDRQQRKMGQFSNIKVTTLFDEQATKANLLYALSRLAGSTEVKLPSGAPPELERIAPAEPEDAVVVYYAGHGTAQGQRFYLIPHDLGYQGKRTELDEAGLVEILSHSVSDLELEQAFENIDAGLVLMVVDACNSGQALEAEEKRRGPMNSKGLAQLAYEKGMYILTAAQSYQAALEAEQLGHGYLTFALIEEGLKSVKADHEPSDGQVLLREWLDYATDRVPRMQEDKMRAARGVRVEMAFVEGEEKVQEVDKRSVQRPRVFYRREQESRPLIVAKQ